MKKTRTAYLLLSDKLISAESYIPFGFILKKLQLIDNVIYISLYPSLTDKINKNLVLQGMVESSGKVLTAKYNGKIPKLILLISTMFRILFTEKPVLVYYRPYDLCNTFVFPMYLITKLKNGRAVILAKSSSVIFDFMEKIRSERYKSDKSKYLKTCNKLYTGKNNDKIFIYHNNKDEIENLDRLFIRPYRDPVVLGLPYMTNMVIDYIDSLFEEAKDNYEFGDRYFLIVLSKEDNPQHMKNKNSFIFTLNKVIKYLLDHYPSYSLIIKPHPLDYEDINSFIQLDFQTNRLFVVYDSAIIYAKNAKRVFNVGPTAVMGHLAKSRKIDVTDYSSAYEFVGMNPYSKIRTLHVSLDDSSEVDRLINDDEYYDSKTSTVLLDELVYEASLMDKKLISYFN